jgi:hypothetical protein
VAVAIHLTFGTITNDFCVQRQQIIQDGATKALAAAESKNFSQAVMGPLRKILKNPELLITCSGNDTVFALYNISLWEDMGFADIVNGLLNGTSLPDFFPNNSSVDQGVQDLIDRQKSMQNLIQLYQSEIPNQIIQMQDFQDDINNASTSYGCTGAPAPPPPPTCDNCCHISNLNQSTNNVLSIYDQINPLLNDTLNQTNELSILLDKIKISRRSIVDTLAQSLDFPELDSSLASSIIDTLGECAWLGSFWQKIVGDALCTKISPSLLWIGWSFALVGITMIFLTPIIIWSLNMKDNGLV